MEKLECTCNGDGGFGDVPRCAACEVEAADFAAYKAGKMSQEEYDSKWGADNRLVQEDED